MADPRDLAVRWLGTVLAGYVDGEVDRLAAAILDQPGVEVEVRHLRITSALTRPASVGAATHQQIAIRLPAQRVGTSDAS